RVRQRRCGDVHRSVQKVEGACARSKITAAHVTDPELLTTIVRCAIPRVCHGSTETTGEGMIMMKSPALLRSFALLFVAALSISICAAAPGSNPSPAPLSDSSPPPAATP